MTIQNTKELENKLNPVTDKAPEVKAIETPKPVRVRFNSTDDYRELAAYMIGYSEEQYESAVNDDNEEDIDYKFLDKFNVDISDFGAIVEALLPMTIPQEKAIRGELSHVMGIFDSIGFRSVVEQCSMLQVVKNDSENQSNEEKPK